MSGSVSTGVWTDPFPEGRFKIDRGGRPNQPPKGSANKRRGLSKCLPLAAAAPRPLNFSPPPKKRGRGSQSNHHGPPSRSIGRSILPTLHSSASGPVRGLGGPNTSRLPTPRPTDMRRCGPPTHTGAVGRTEMGGPAQGRKEAPARAPRRFRSAGRAPCGALRTAAPATKSARPPEMPADPIRMLGCDGLPHARALAAVRRAGARLGRPAHAYFVVPRSRPRGGPLGLR